MVDQEQVSTTYKSTGTIKGTARALGIDRRTVRKYLAKGVTIKPQAKSKECRSGLTRAELMAKYDDSTRAREAIRRGISKLLSDISSNPEDDEVLDESRFRSELCDGVVSPSFKRVAAEPEFRKYRFSIGEKLFWTTPRTKDWSLKNISKAKEVMD
jgi:DNA invertase Pin-like site-specific DNA recombinase